jgi:hypothetical protein
MPRYFFHARRGDALTTDDQGQDLPDLDTARTHACKVAEALWSDMPPEMPRQIMTVEVADETGQTVLKVPFAEAGKGI